MGQFMERSQILKSEKEAWGIPCSVVQHSPSIPKSPESIPSTERKGKENQVEKVPRYTGEQNLFSHPKRHSVWGGGRIADNCFQPAFSYPSQLGFAGVKQCK